MLLHKTIPLLVEKCFHTKIWTHSSFDSLQEKKLKYFWFEPSRPTGNPVCIWHWLGQIRAITKMPSIEKASVFTSADFSHFWTTVPAILAVEAAVLHCHTKAMVDANCQWRQDLGHTRYSSPPHFVKPLNRIEKPGQEWLFKSFFQRQEGENPNIGSNQPRAIQLLL